ncbi:MAG: permease-like cell division protein FtsX [Fimbriimonadaceae bacterium]|nr:permease-like cell division protein FtsX [Fimbriimonadaceae bacterium]
MLDRIEFLITEALTAFRRNHWMTFAAVTTAAMALFLLGGLGFAYFRLEGLMAELRQDYRLRVFLKDGLTQEQKSQALGTIRNLDGVETATLIDRRKGLEVFAQENPDIPVADFVNDNPLPDAIHVTLTEIDKTPQITEQILKQTWVEPNGVRSLNELRLFLQSLISGSRLVGFTLGSIMLLTGGILIYNTIRLTIMARRREMRIMELVGANRRTIVLPLLVEGMIDGMLGGLVAFIFLFFSVRAIEGIILSLDSFAKFQGIPVGPTLFLLLSAGAVYGLVCSMLASRDVRTGVA